MSQADLHAYVSPTAELIEEARAGRMFVLVDDEDRENEGDLVIPAQFATPDAVNFMARHARGLICLSLTRDRVQHLGLPLMSRANGTRHETAFTVSIEAREGVTTGISAADRARTIAAAINPAGSRDDIVTPGHVFPLMARDGGTLIRAGHTEAAVDIARLAGLNPAGVICEIMNDDGSMARLPELVAFAQHHGLKLGTIADLIAHRHRTEQLVRRVAETEFRHPTLGDWRLLVYATDTIDYCEHIVLLKGAVAGSEPALVRMHSVDMVDSMLFGPRWQVFGGALHAVAEAGRGALVLLREARPTQYSEAVRAHARSGRVTSDIRDHGIGAQILADLGIRKLILLSNTPHHVVALEGYGLQVVEQRPVALRPVADIGAETLGVTGGLAA
jgi:3,4-dihydroxy 2-butanone 4-phosphate synthase/GTP cyclohydrolase II